MRRLTEHYIYFVFRSFIDDVEKIIATFILKRKIIFKAL